MMADIRLFDMADAAHCDTPLRIIITSFDFDGRLIADVS